MNASVFQQNSLHNSLINREAAKLICKLIKLYTDDGKLIFAFVFLLFTRIMFTSLKNGNHSFWKNSVQWSPFSKTWTNSCLLQKCFWLKLSSLFVIKNFAVDNNNNVTACQLQQGEGNNQSKPIFILNRKLLLNKFCKNRGENHTFCQFF